MANPIPKTHDSVKIDTRLQFFRPEHFNVNDKLHHLKAKFNSKITATKEIQPTKKEFKLLQKGFVAEAERVMAVQPLVKISNTRMIVTDGKQETFECFEKDAFVTVFTGKGRPSVDDAADFTRANVSGSEQVNGLRLRWVKIGFANDSSDQTISEALRQQLSKLPNSVDYTCFHVKLGFRSDPVKLADILWHTGDAANPDRRNFNLAALNSLVAEGTNSGPTAIDDDIVALHGHKSYSLLDDKVKTIKGLEFVCGTARKLWFNGYINDSFILTEKNCFKCFFPAVSVANFLDEYLSTTKTLYDIKDTLVGVKVRIRTASGHEDKHILKLGEAPVTVSETSKHPAWIAKGKLALQYPDLPCVNVGTTGKPELAPVEMCKILPMQSAGKEVPFAIQMATSRERHEAIRLDKSRQYQGKVTEKVISRAHPKVSVEDGKKKFKAAFGESPKILFVGAGAGDKPPTGWKELCKRVLSNADPSSDDETALPNLEEIATHTVSLNYTPGSNFTATWKGQLEKLIANHTSDSAGEPKVLIVVAILTSEHDKIIYETLKTICDSTDIGKQTFFVNMGTLASKQRESPTEGAKKAANEILQRMRIRNPPFIGNKEADLSIGVHVSHFAAQTAELKADGNFKPGQVDALLVTTVSRELQDAQGYKMSRELVTDVDNFDPAAYIGPHLEGRVPKHVILFRSGYLPTPTPTDTTVTAADIDGRTMLQQKSDSLQDDLSKGFKKLDFEKNSESVYFSAEILEEFATKCSIAASANVELVKLQNAVKENGVSLSYILVDEHDAFEITASAKGTIAKQAVESAARAKAKADVGDSSHVRNSTSFFINDSEKTSDDQYTIKMHRKISPKTGGKAVSLTLLGAKLTEEILAEEPPSATASTVDDSGYGSRARSPSELEDESNKDTPRARNEEPQDASSPTPVRTNGDRPATSRSNTDSSADNSDSGTGPANGILTSLRDKVPNPWPEKVGQSLDAVGGPDSVIDDSTSQASSGMEDRKKKIEDRRAATIIPSKTNKMHKDHDQSPDSGVGLTVNDGSKITSAELEVLADLFYDTQLELYDTKLPIPTYLAQAATKRAKMHLRRTLENDNERVELPQVADEVANSLYYL